jgi:hypothetical protein
MEAIFAIADDLPVNSGRGCSAGPAVHEQRISPGDETELRQPVDRQR